MVEQRTENPCVTGSIPVGTTNQAVGLISDCFFFVYGKDCQSSRKTEVGFFDVLPMNYNSSRRLIRVQAVEKYGESPIGMRIRNHLFPFLCRRKKQKRLSQITNNKVLIPYELLLHENFVLRNFATAIPRECCILRNIF